MAGVDAGGDDGLHGAHLQVLIENAVGGQSGQNRIAHTIISLSQNFERISGEGGTAEPFRPQLVRGGSSRFEGQAALTAFFFRAVFQTRSAAPSTTPMTEVMISGLMRQMAATNSSTRSATLSSTLK